ncbi:MAG: hypothetical protein S4CHLAM37_03440 [Chlamydiia bacterium]|nr:hypothetical protein [Chlamydiia bacterium]
MANDYGRFLQGEAHHSYLLSYGVGDGDHHLVTVPEDEIGYLREGDASGRINWARSYTPFTRKDGASAVYDFTKADEGARVPRESIKATNLVALRAVRHFDPVTQTRGVRLERQYYLPETETGYTRAYGEFTSFSDRSGGLEPLYADASQIGYLNRLLETNVHGLYKAKELFETAVQDYRTAKHAAEDTRGFYTTTVATRQRVAAEKLAAIDVAHSKFKLVQFAFDEELTKRLEHPETLDEAAISSARDASATANLDSAFTSVAPMLPSKDTRGDPIRANDKYARDLYAAYKATKTFFVNEGAHAPDATKLSLLYDITRALRAAFRDAPDVRGEISRAEGTARTTVGIPSNYGDFLADFEATRDYTENECLALFQGYYQDATQLRLPSDFLKRVPPHMKEFVQTFWKYKLKQITEDKILHLIQGKFERFGKWLVSTNIRPREMKHTSMEKAAKRAAEQFNFGGGATTAGTMYVETVLSPSDRLLAGDYLREAEAKCHSVNVNNICFELEGIAQNLSSHSTEVELEEAVRAYSADRAPGLFTAMETKFQALRRINGYFSDSGFKRHLIPGSVAFNVDSEYKKARKVRDKIYADRAKYTRMYFEKRLEALYGELSATTGHNVTAIQNVAHYHDIMDRIQGVQTEIVRFFNGADGRSGLNQILRQTEGSLSATSDEVPKFPSPAKIHADRIAAGKLFLRPRVDELSAHIDTTSREVVQGNWPNRRTVTHYDQGEMAAIEQHRVDLQALEAAGDDAGVAAALANVQGSFVAYEAARVNLTAIQAEFHDLVDDAGARLRGHIALQGKDARFTAALETSTRAVDGLVNRMSGYNLQAEIARLEGLVAAIPDDGGHTDGHNYKPALADLQRHFAEMQRELEKFKAVGGVIALSQYGALLTLMENLQAKARAVAGVQGDGVDIAPYGNPLTPSGARILMDRIDNLIRNIPDDGGAAEGVNYRDAANLLERLHQGLGDAMASHAVVEPAAFAGVLQGRYNALAGAMGPKILAARA